MTRPALFASAGPAALAALDAMAVPLELPAGMALTTVGQAVEGLWWLTEGLIEAQLPDDVQAALLALPEDYRAAVVLCDVVGFSYQEIAESLELSEGGAKNLLERVKAKLKECVERRLNG